MRKQYKMLQMELSVHTKLKKHCEENGYKMSAFIENLFTDYLSGINHSRDWDERYRMKRLMEEMFGMQIPKVDKVTDYETFIKEGSNKSE